MVDPTDFKDTQPDKPIDKIPNVQDSDTRMKLDDEAKPIQVEAKDDIELMMKLEDISKELMGWFNKWDSWRRPFESTWDEIYRNYLSVIRASKVPTRAKIFIPVTFQVIETAVSKFINLILSNDDPFDVIATDPREEPQAQVIHKLLLYQLSKANFFMKFIDFVKQLVMYGTSYFKIYWKVKREWVWSRSPIRKDVSIFGFKMGSRITGWEEKKEFKVTERRPEIDVLDIMDVFPDPSAATEKEGKGLFIRSWMDYNKVKMMGAGKYPVFANVTDLRLQNGSKTYTAARANRFSARGVGDTTLLDKNQVEILEFWGLWDLDNDGIDEECYIVLGNRQVILKAVPNPFHHQKRPIVRANMFPVPMEWFGVGLVEPIIPLQHELNTLRRQRLDNINIILNRMWKVNSLSDVDVDTLISQPNGIILTDDMAAVESMTTPDVTASSYSDAATIQGDIENVTVPKSAQGIPESGRLGRTARGAQLIIGQAMEKFGTAAKMIEDTAIKRVLRMFHQLNLQFLDTEDVAREIGVTGSVFNEKITPEMIRAEVSFRMSGVSDMIGKEGKINQIINFYGVFKETLTPETMAKLSSKVWELMGFNPDDVQIVAQNLTPALGNPQEAQNTQAALEGQVARNGANTPPSVPGVTPQ